jgi:hypothetical protein
MAAGISRGQRRARQPGGRCVRVVVRVTPKEYDQLTRHATDVGLTIPSYLADLGLTPTAVPAALLRSVLTHTTALRRILTTSPAAPAGLAESTRDATELREVIDRLTALLEAADTSISRARSRS